MKVSSILFSLFRPGGRLKKLEGEGSNNNDNTKEVLVLSFKVKNSRGG
jgi:hypothetical protein